MTIQIANHDRLSFYVGNDWKGNFKFNVSNFERLQNLAGIFTTVDSTTVKSLYNFYQFNCDSTCSPIRVELKSSDQSGFVFEADNQDLFNLKMGLHFQSPGQ